VPLKQRKEIELASNPVLGFLLLGVDFDSRLEILPKDIRQKWLLPQSYLELEWSLSQAKRVHLGAFYESD
jgi:hypothetical protein